MMNHNDEKLNLNNFQNLIYLLKQFFFTYFKILNSLANYNKFFFRQKFDSLIIYLN